MSKDVAIVTGASRGIGPHIAQALADAGYPVLLTARSGGELDQRSRSIARSGGRVVAVQADLTLEADRRRIIERAREVGPISVLVNNAALGPIANFHEHTAAEVADVIAVNLSAPVDLARLAVSDMLATGGGRVVNVATVAAKLPMPHMVLYSLTKAGLAQFTRALNLEYADRGIRAVTVLPGAVAEEGMSVRAVTETGVDIPSEGAVKPHVVAEAVVAAARGSDEELFVGKGSRLLTKHPRVAASLMRRSGVFAALSEAAERYREVYRSAA